MSPPALKVSWHAQSAQDALRALDAVARGLAPEEAARRRKTHGPNSLPRAQGRHPVLRFLAHFNNALIYFLLAAALAAAVLAHFVDAAVIVAVVVVNAVIGFVQEGKAENALAAMHRMIS
ncbi:MAG: cation-transporting P-type ATPase, partial [Burkholderiales bacterium]